MVINPMIERIKTSSWPPQFQAVQTYFTLLKQSIINSLRFYGKHTKLAESHTVKKSYNTPKTKNLPFNITNFSWEITLNPGNICFFFKGVSDWSVRKVGVSKRIQMTSEKKVSVVWIWISNLYIDIFFYIPKDPFVCPKKGIISIILKMGWDVSTINSTLGLENKQTNQTNLEDILPFSQYLVTSIYKPFRLFGKGITPVRGQQRSPWLLTTY